MENPDFACRLRKMILTITSWFKIYFCFTIISYNGLVYYLIFKWWHRSSALFNKANNMHITTSEVEMYYRITGNFCSNLISAVFCGELRTVEIKIAEFYVK